MMSINEGFRASAATFLLVCGFFTGFFSLAPSAAFAGDGGFHVRPTIIQDRKAVFATVETADVVLARTRIGGTLVSLVVDEGSKVDEGQVIARVVDPKLKLGMDAIQARIESLESRKKLARIDLERAKKLRKSGTIAQARLDKVQSGLEVADRDLASAIAELDVIRQQESEGDVMAPAAGRVTKIHLTRGAVVLAGETVATIAAKAYILRMQLPERHARFTRNGDVVRVGLRDGGEVEGRIRQVYPEMKQGRVVADVEVDGLGDFFVGERIPVIVSTGERRTFVVPEDYLFRRYGLTFVLLQSGGEVVVQPGQQADGGIEILAGVREGDVLLRPTAAR